MNKINKRYIAGFLVILAIVIAFSSYYIHMKNEKIEKAKELLIGKEFYGVNKNSNFYFTSERSYRLTFKDEKKLVYVVNWYFDEKGGDDDFFSAGNETIEWDIKYKWGKLELVFVTEKGKYLKNRPAEPFEICYSSDGTIYLYTRNYDSEQSMFLYEK